MQAAESAEQLSEALLEDLLEDTARAAWAAETNRELEGMAECRLQAPTLESMLLRMEEIQVRSDLQKGPSNRRSARKPKRSPAIGLLFIASCCDSLGLVLFTDAASSLELIMTFSPFDAGQYRQVDTVFIKRVSSG